LSATERGILARCQACGATQRLYLPDHDRPSAEMLAGLMDGTSPLFVHPPGPDSQIGRCETCGGRFRCELFGWNGTERKGGNRSAQFVIIEDDPPRPLKIRDVGPWTEHPSVTNDAEAVVRRLAGEGRLPQGRRLLYYDSEGKLDELVVKDGRFSGFVPGTCE
jgi:hypothetical protein